MSLLRKKLAGTGVVAVLLAGMASAPALADDEPTVDVPTVSADETTDINDRSDCEDEPESAIKQPNYCDGPYTWYAITSKKNYFVPSWWNGTSWKDGPGGTMNVSVTKSGTISAEVTGSLEWSSNAVIAKAKASVSVKIGGSFSISTGHQYTHPVHSNKYGHLQYGSWGCKVTWAHYQRVGSCGVKTIGSGKAILPTSGTGWKYWETSS
ncbi:hypothetical protein [Streptomyces sp. 2231.1]|uniref:hypothetical protein n=1 Tax=Streptomyces sp. 2231.1 TaxID=1855347 RepID=UPI00210B94B6|nr:hypothetical protein [Streptomyces sp. 2231.1]